MGSILLVDEEVIQASPESLFEMFGAGEGGGWLFGAECEAPVRGCVVRFELPLDGVLGGMALGTGRIVEVKRPRRIVIEHESPWRGRVTCTIAPTREGSRIRLVAELSEESLRWLLRRRGATLEPEARPDEVPVGLLISQSGPGSLFAGATERLAQLAIEEANECRPPGTRALRLVVGDDGTSPELGVAEARRLVQDEGCPVVIASTTSATFEAIQPVVRELGALLVYSITNEGGPCGSRVFRFGERPWSQLHEAVPQLMSATGTNRWYFIGDDYCWPRATHRCARQIVEQAGGSVVAERFVPLGSRDFTPLLDEIDRSGAELLLSTFVGADAAAFERQFYAAGLRSRCQTLAPALDESTREHIGGVAGEGIWTVFGYFEQLPSAANRGFLQRYRKRFGACSPPVSSFSEAAYEAFHLVIRAAWRARSWDPTEVAGMLASSRFDGPRGQVAVTDHEHLEQSLYLGQAVPGGFAVREAVG